MTISSPASSTATRPAAGATSISMTPLERRAGGSLATVYAARMLGLFLVLPVFALEAAHYPGGSDPAMVGLAMGIYGLTQALLQIPFGLASDKFGRKRVIIFGLFLFAVGSFVAAAAPTLVWLTVGRAIQGGGAVSAAVTALLADQTRDIVRTKAMALIGASIGLTFALSIVAGPLLGAHVGLGGLFAITGMLALTCIAIVAWWTPPEPLVHKNLPRGKFTDVFKHAGLLRLNVGVFVLYAVQLATWVAIPALLVSAGLAKADHWHVYLPTVLASFVVMGVTLFPLERKGRLRELFLASVALVALVQVALVFMAGAPSLVGLTLALFVFFCGFNVLEASQPSMASRMAPPQTRGAALGVYNTLQSLGLFAGGAVGGWLSKSVGPQGLFAVCGAMMLLWLVVAWPMRTPAPSRVSPDAALADEPQAT